MEIPSRVRLERVNAPHQKQISSWEYPAKWVTVQAGGPPLYRVWVNDQELGCVHPQTAQNEGELQAVGLWTMQMDLVFPDPPDPLKKPGLEVYSNAPRRAHLLLHPWEVGTFGRELTLHVPCLEISRGNGYETIEITSPVPIEWNTVDPDLTAPSWGHKAPVSAQTTPASASVSTVYGFYGGGSKLPVTNELIDDEFGGYDFDGEEPEEKPAIVRELVAIGGRRKLRLGD